jgi:hypothetical protein
MAYQGSPSSGRATGAVNRGNAQNAQATRPASDLPANAQRGPSEEEEEEGPLLEILGLFTDYVIPGKRDEFATTLLGVLERLDLRPQSDASSETLREEIQELRGSIVELSKALPKAQSRNTWAEVAARGGCRSSGNSMAETPRIVVPERRTRQVITV